MITHICIYFFLAIALDMIQFRLTAGNYWSKYNGIGAVHDVMGGRADAPMQYRILVPAIYIFFEKLFGSSRFYEGKTFNTVFIYEPLKILFMFLGLWAFHLYLSVYFVHMIAFAGTILMALFWVVTFQYDYADCYLDVCLWSLFCWATLTGQAELVIIVFVLAVLNREVSFLLAGLYFLLTDNISIMWLLLILGAVIYVAMYAVFGNKPRYCTTREIFRLNWQDVCSLFKKPVQADRVGLPVFNGVFLFFVVILGLALLALNYESYPPGIQALWLINIPFMVLVLLGARIVELRVLMPMALSAIPSLFLIWGG